MSVHILFLNDIFECSLFACSLKFDCHL